MHAGTQTHASAYEYACACKHHPAWIDRVYAIDPKAASQLEREESAAQRALREDPGTYRRSESSLRGLRDPRAAETTGEQER